MGIFNIKSIREKYSGDSEETTSAHEKPWTREEPATPEQASAPKTFSFSPNATRKYPVNANGKYEAYFVCTGNIARSTSSQMLANALSEEYGLDNWEFKSAGTSALVGLPMYHRIAKVWEAKGYDTHGYRAQQLTEDMIENATLLLVADKDHAEWIMREWPQHHAKVHLLKQVARLAESSGKRAEPLSTIYADTEAPLPEDNISDPFRQGDEACQKAAGEIEDALRAFLPWLAKAQG